MLVDLPWTPVETCDKCRYQGRDYGDPHYCSVKKLIDYGDCDIASCPFLQSPAVVEVAKVKEILVKNAHPALYTLKAEVDVETIYEELAALTEKEGK